MQLLTIVKAQYIDGYRIEATFSNGIKKMLDFSTIIKNAKGIVRKPADISYFRNFTLDPFTIDWNGEIGFDPKDLYEHGESIGYDDSAEADHAECAAEEAVR